MLDFGVKHLDFGWDLDRRLTLTNTLKGNYHFDIPYNHWQLRASKAYED